LAIVGHNKERTCTVVSLAFHRPSGLETIYSSYDWF
jgi:hypothetical protein